MSSAVNTEAEKLAKQIAETMSHESLISAAGAVIATNTYWKQLHVVVELVTEYLEVYDRTGDKSSSGDLRQAITTLKTLESSHV